MTGAFVVDCSVAMTWLFPEERSVKTEELLDRIPNETAVVPSLWLLEVTNVIALAELRGRVTALQTQAFLQRLGEMAIEHDDQGVARAFSNVLPLCRAHHLTSYDAVYLELAIRRDLPLATLDMPLRKAAKKAGVKLLGM